jgi:DNA-binding NarL/FixJ family response regulator
MPGMDGYEAAHEIRRRAAEAARSRVPIIALTAHVVGPAAEAWRDADMDAVLHKPFNLKALAATLGRFLTPAAAGESAPPIAASPLAPALSGLAARDDLFDPEVITQLGELAANGRRDFVEKVVGLYVVNAPRCVADLRAAANSRRAEDISEAAHALKSMSYTIGASGVAAAAADLEAASLDGAIPENAATGALDALLRETLAALDFEGCCSIA